MSSLSAPLVGTKRQYTQISGSGDCVMCMPIGVEGCKSETVIGDSTEVHGGDGLRLGVGQFSVSLAGGAGAAVARVGSAEHEVAAGSGPNLADVSFA